MSIDAILIRMAQFNKHKNVLDRMRKQQPKTRINSGTYAVRKAVPEYQYINYDLDLIKKEYEIPFPKLWYERIPQSVGTMIMEF